jgi:phage-related protein
MSWYSELRQDIESKKINFWTSISQGLMSIFAPFDDVLSTSEQMAKDNFDAIKSDWESVGIPIHDIHSNEINKQD